jgi:UDP-N-acetylglucosamine acyltransferase
LLARFLKRPPAESIPDDVPALRAAGGPLISPLAHVDPKAHIGDDCEIEPFCFVGPEVTLGNGCKLLSHAVITGRTTIGVDNIFHSHCTIGGIPQDKKYRGEPTELVIGDRNIFRESVTVNTGTVQGGGFTRLGSRNLLMANCHVGHDCQIGDDNVLANNVMLAGHMVIGNHVVMSGGAAAHHYVSIGDYAFVAGMARIHHDVPPFVKLSEKDKIRAMNKEGMKRGGFSNADIDEIEEAGRKLFFAREKTFSAVMADFEADENVHPQVKVLIEFIRRRNIGKYGRYLESLRTKK